MERGVKVYTPSAEGGKREGSEKRERGREGERGVYILCWRWKGRR